MFCEAKDDRTNNIEISFIVPQEEWNEMKTEAEWKAMEKKITKAQQRDLADIYYRRLPLIEEKIRRAEVMTKRLIGLLVPIILLIVTVLTLLK